MVREKITFFSQSQGKYKHIVDENSGKVREKFFLKKRMNSVFIKQQRTVLNFKYLSAGTI